MDATFLDHLPRLLTQGRREAQRLASATGGRYRERARRDESISPDESTVRESANPPNRILRGDPLLSLAALLAEARQGELPGIGVASADLHPVHANDTLLARLARWIPRWVLLRHLAPDAAALVRAPRDEHAVLQLVLDSVWPAARAVDELPRFVAVGARRLLVADTASALLPQIARPGPWIACAPDAHAVAQLRRAILSARESVAIDLVGDTPGEWARHNVSTRPVAAMHAALAAFGAVPLRQTSAGRTGSGRRRAGMEVLLGECRIDDARTLVWVDAPDRRTGDATLCRAIMKREIGTTAWDRVVVLGWHFVPTFAQHLALRCDARIEAYAIPLLPRAGVRGAPLRIDAGGFRHVDGLRVAWIDRRRSQSARDHEWLTVRLEGDARFDDWSVDADHDGEVFRGCWHAVRDGEPGQRSVRLRVPWLAAARRVCVRAIDAHGRVSEVVVVVDERPGAHRPLSTAPRAALTQARALC